MTLDVVVPSYNRSALLERTLKSLLAAPVPPGLVVNIYVVDNNSTDDTAELVRRMQSQTTAGLHYLFEARQSSSHARNLGINAGTGELIGFIDDDEEVDAAWYSVVQREFQDPAVDFIGGPYFAQPGLQLPDWLPPSYPAAIGVQQVKGRAAFGAGHEGNLNSGNAVLRRGIFDRIGLYSGKLGRSGRGLLSEEDADLYRRIQKAGFAGVFVPELVIYHHVPPERLSRRYHRRWCFWRGVSLGVVDREQHEPTAYSLGVPRYRIGRAVKALTQLPAAVLSGRSSAAFDAELALWDLAGFIHGKHFVRIERYYKSS